jgi:hypothetical protein
LVTTSPITSRFPGMVFNSPEILPAQKENNKTYLTKESRGGKR